MLTKRGPAAGRERRVVSMRSVGQGTSFYREPLYFAGSTSGEEGQFYQSAIVSALAGNEAVGVVGGSFDEDFSVRFVSGFALQNLQMTFQDFLDATGGSFLELVYPDDREEFVARMAADPAQRWEYRLVDKAGKPRWFEECRGQCEAPDDTPLWVCSLRQVNEAHLFQAELLSRVSHDMRTPLNAIMGTADRIAARAADEETKDDCYVIRAAAFRLLDMVERSLELSEEEAAAPSRCVPFALSDMMENAACQVDQKLAGKRQPLRTSLDVRHDTVVADRANLVKVLRVLLENASTFSPKGSAITLSVVEGASLRPGHGAYSIEVADSGIGIAPEYIGKIFEPFVRVADSRLSDDIPHVGLGLAVAKSLVKAMGGKLVVESEPGVGSVFKVQLEMPLAEDLNRGSFEGKRILVVEDNALNLEIICDYLKTEGALVTVAQDGSQAVGEFLGRGSGYFDCITMDIHMPVMDGYEATALIRAAEDCGGDSVRIVAVTSDNSEADIRRIMEAGMDAHVPKPIDFKALKDALIP